ncbi:hypothetical protein KW803_03195 [Candidatus Saccharibacteria bacterium]|nr:hypothetical protein [Candidatus Saccharibacteria bacterium]
MKLTSKNTRLILFGCLGLSIALFIGITFLGLSALGKESQQMVELKVASQTADNQLSNLEQSRKDIEKYSFFKDIAKSVIPNDKDQAVAVLEINKMAEASGISIQSITFPSSSLGLRTAIPTTTESTPKETTTPVTATAAISQAKPVAGIPGLYSLELIITPGSGKDVPPEKQVTYAKMLAFLNRIENNRHTAQITQVNIQPAGQNQGISFTLTINIFIKP